MGNRHGFMESYHEDAALGLTSLIKEAEHNLEMFPEFFNIWELDVGKSLCFSCRG